MDKITQIISRLFEKHRIVFWYDAKQELRQEYEDEILYPLAIQQININLDDGVKVNYGKFGKALKPIGGL